MTRIQGVIFDYGSTLMQFEADPEEIAPLAARELAHQLWTDGVPVKAEMVIPQFTRALENNDQRRLRELIDVPIEEVLAEALGELGLQDVPHAALGRALQAYYAEYEKHWHLFPETRTVLDGLRSRKLRLGMLTNAGDAENIRRLLIGHTLTGYFDPIVISSVERRRKPDATLFQKILNAWRIAASSTVMVGDQLGMDVLGARNAGIRSIWLRTEADMPANRADRGKIIPDAEADSIGEVPAILRRWEEEPS